ncbi:MAG TPA: hypothetical protein VG147_14325 [Solirubrobacteraceae bacterium]|jgi:hypothetical protein|nr:hypothetical protein [Solirubrobacteraceae bacterium]
MQSATLAQRIRSRPPHSLLARLRAVPGATWARLGFAALCVGALVGYFAFPTYPTYDSFYALLWGRDLLHLQLPDFNVYRAPTEHPLAIAFGMLCSLFGQTGARLMVLGSIASFVALTAGLFRLTRLCFGPLVAVLAALLTLTRLYDANLAAQGYLDLTYLALIVWATALEVERSRRGVPVFVLLALAGLLRPDAWVLAGVYWLWCAWPARALLWSGAGRGSVAAGTSPWADRGAPAVGPSPRTLLGYAALVAAAPLLWVAIDTLVTGDPLYSLHSTAVLAAELERTKGFTAVLAATWRYLVRIDKLPIVLGGLAGAVLGIWLTPRRARVPLAVLALLLLVYVAEGAAGASVIDRYMMGAAALLLPFCALAIGGWSLLRAGSALRRVWMAAGAALLVYGAVAAVSVTSLSNARTTLAYHDDFHEGLAAALHSPAVRAELARCPLLSLPDNKLIPDARWILGASNQREIVARSEARADSEAGDPTLTDRIARASVAVYPLGAAVFQEAIVDVGDNPLDQVALPGFRRIYTSRYYAVYGNC